VSGRFVNDSRLASDRDGRPFAGSVRIDAQRLRAAADDEADLAIRFFSLRLKIRCCRITILATVNFDDPVGHMRCALVVWVNGCNLPPTRIKICLYQISVSWVAETVWQGTISIDSP
jgi:hypothetical protein